MKARSRVIRVDLDVKLALSRLRKKRKDKNYSETLRALVQWFRSIYKVLP